MSSSSRSSWLFLHSNKLDCPSLLQGSLASLWRPRSESGITRDVIPNGIVLDPVCGSGTTLAVAKKLGRRYIRIDINPNYVDIAIECLLKIGSSEQRVSGQIVFGLGKHVLSFK